MPPVPLILSIDPGEHCGLALYQEGQLIAAEAADGTSWKMLSRKIKSMLPKEKPGERRCTIEDGWGVGIGSKTLDRRRGIAQAAAESCGFPIPAKYVFPATWQAYFWGGLKGRNTKELSVSHARQLPDVVQSGIQVSDHNVADAILLGRWTVDTLA